MTNPDHDSVNLSPAETDAFAKIQRQFEQDNSYAESRLYKHHTATLLLLAEAITAPEKPELAAYSVFDSGQTQIIIEAELDFLVPPEEGMKTVSTPKNIKVMLQDNETNESAVIHINENNLVPRSVVNASGLIRFIPIVPAHVSAPQHTLTKSIYEIGQHENGSTGRENALTAFTKTVADYISAGNAYIITGKELDETVWEERKLTYGASFNNLIAPPYNKPENGTILSELALATLTVTDQNEDGSRTEFSFRRMLDGKTSIGVLRIQDSVCTVLQDHDSPTELEYLIEFVYLCEELFKAYDIAEPDIPQIDMDDGKQGNV